MSDLGRREEAESLANLQRDLSVSYPPVIPAWKPLPSQHGMRPQRVTKSREQGPLSGFHLPYENTVSVPTKSYRTDWPGTSLLSFRLHPPEL